MTFDASGNAVVTGTFTGSVDFGGGARSSTQADLFVAAYSPANAHVWSRRYGATNTQSGSAISVGSNNRIVVAGYFTGSIDFGSGLKNNTGGTTFDGVVASLANPPS